MTSPVLPPVPGLPPGTRASSPGLADVEDATALLRSSQASATGRPAADADSVAAALVGSGSWTRRQVLVRGADGRLLAWASVHDRAAGRTVVDVTVSPQAAGPLADRLAGACFAWAEQLAAEVTALRGRAGTQLDSGAYAADPRQQRWLSTAGYSQVRTWLQMSRPVSPQEGRPGAPAAPRAGVIIRPVATHGDGSPVAADLQTVHRMLEESFADHFNSYRESFPEFVQRLREDPGHRWDHWWVAEVSDHGVTVPGGALVGSVLGPDGEGSEGSYVDYIGVHRRARGRGVAKALLATVIRDAAERGRNRVGLEVDADSPTGADGLYTSMGWATAYRTQSWHRDLAL